MEDVCPFCVHKYPWGSEVTEVIPLPELGALFNQGVEIYANFYNIPIPEHLCDDCIDECRWYRCECCEENIVSHDPQLDPPGYLSKLIGAPRLGVVGGHISRETWLELQRQQSPNTPVPRPPLRKCIRCGDDICNSCSTPIAEIQTKYAWLRDHGNDIFKIPDTHQNYICRACIGDDYTYYFGDYMRLWKLYYFGIALNCNGKVLESLYHHGAEIEIPQL